MSFLYNPMNSCNQTIPNYYNPQSARVVGQYGGEVYRQQESLVQFKVFAYEKLNHFTGRNPSVIRFELFQNRTFTDFLNVLKNHSIGANSYKFSYLDDEHDLIVLSTENDFRYMMKLMKGKTITIVCEKIPQVSNPVFTQPRVSNPNPFRNLPFFMQPQERRQEQEGNEESLIEKALESVFNGIFEEKKQEATPQRMQCMFPRANQEQQANSRIRTIRLSDLLKQNSEETKAQEKRQEESAPRVRIVKLSDLLKNSEEAQKEDKQEKETKSFEDFIAELFGKKLAERKSQEAKQEEQPKNEAYQHSEKKEETLSEPTVETNQNAEEEKQPVLSTSQIISNYLLDNEEDEDEIDEDEEEEYDESDDESSEMSEEEDLLYPTIENDSLQTNETNQQFEKELKLLSDMGFNETNENIRLLKKYNGDIQRVVSDLIYYY